MPKRAILDVDGTLWDLMSPVHRILEIKFDVVMGTPDRWNYHRDFVSDEAFYEAVRQAHAEQLKFPPYAGADKLFYALNEAGYEVIVASHRPPQMAEAIANWLRLNDLGPYSGIYCGRDKHFLIQYEDLVIDDRPDTIRYANRENAQALSLTYRYNWPVLNGSKEGLIEGSPIPRGFHTLEDMSAWIQTRIKKRKRMEIKQQWKKA